MKYEPVVPKKRYLICTVFVNEDRRLCIKDSETDEPNLNQISAEFRRPILAGTVASYFILSSDSVSDSIGQITNSDEVIFDPDSDVMTRKDDLLESVNYLKKTWPSDYSYISECIYDLDTALMALSMPLNSQLSEAFCPKGSKGFMRAVVPITRVNPKVKIKETKPRTIADLIMNLSDIRSTNLEFPE